MKYLIIIILFCANSTFCQININKPKHKAVYQRDNNNNSVIPINGTYFNSGIKSVKARLVAQNGGNTTNWEYLSISGSEFNGKLKSTGGWYKFELELTNTLNETIIIENQLVGIGEVFVVAGQSNTLGTGNFSTDDRVIGFNFAHSGEGFDYFIDLTNKNSGKNTAENKYIGPNSSVRSFMSKLGDRLVQQYNVPVLFFSTGASATTIQEWSNSTTEPYNSLKNCLLYRAQEFGYRGILWHQGETNSMFTTTPRETFYNYFKELILNSRRDTYYPELAWCVARVSWSKYELLGPSDSDPNSLERRAETRAGQELTYKRLPFVFEGPDSDLIEGYKGSEKRHDGVHFTLKGNDELGNMWFDKLMENDFFQKTNPILSNAIKKEPQYINFTNINDQFLFNKKIELKATSNSGLPISYRIISGPAYISGQYLFFNGSPGTIFVEASSMGNAEYFSASEIRNFNVTKAKQSLSFAALQDIDLNVESVLLNIESSNKENLKIKINYGPVRIANEKIYLNGTAGDVSINAEMPENDDYEGISITRNFKIKKIKNLLKVNQITNKYVDEEAFNLITETNSNQNIDVNILEGPCTYTNGKLKLSGQKGLVKIEIKQAENDKYEASESKIIEFSVKKYSQTLNFEPISNRTVLDSIVILNPIISSGLAPTIKLKSGPATLINNELKLHKKEGKIVYSLSQAGTQKYEEIPETIYSFEVKKISQNIDIEPIKDKLLSDSTFIIMAKSTSKLPIFFEKVYGPIELNNNSIKILGKAGNVKIRALQPGNEIYAEAPSQEVVFQIEKLNQVFNFEKINNTYFDSPEFTINYKSNSKLKPSFIVKKGPITLKDSLVILNGNTGDVTIEVVQNGNETYKPIEAQLNFKVLKRPSSIVYNKIESQIYAFKNIALGLQPTHKQAIVISKIIKGNGTIKNDTLFVTKPSIFEIQFTQDSTSQYEASTAKLNFEIFKIAQSISIEKIPFQFNTTKIVPFKFSKKTNNLVKFNVLEGPASFKDSTLFLTGQTGVVTITLTQDENDFYFPAFATQSFFVNSLVGNEPASNLYFTAHPIPFSNELTLNTKNKPAKVRVYNSLGMEVLNTFLNKNGTINVANLPSGIYWLAVFSDINNKPEIIKVQKL